MARLDGKLSLGVNLDLQLEVELLADGIVRLIVESLTGPLVPMVLP